MKDDNINYLIATLSEKNDWISANELASYLHTTTRTIRNYVATVNARAKSEIILHSHKGYKWNGHSYSFVPQDLSSDTYDTPEKRIRHILRQLLYIDTGKEKHLSIEDLCDNMGLSYRTIETDLNSIKELLKQYDISLHTRKDRLDLSGSESDIRRLIFHVICQKHNDLPDLRSLEDIYPAIPIAQAKERLETAISSHGLSIDSFHLPALLLYIIIQVMRISSKHLIRQEEIHIPNIEKRSEYRIAEEVASILSDELDLLYTWWEKYYLTMILIVMCHEVSPNDDGYDPEITAFSDYVIGKLESLEAISYREDEFPEHLKDVLYRLFVAGQYKIAVYNPLRSFLRNSSPVLHDHAAWIVSEFDERFRIRTDRYQLAYFEMFLLAYQRKRKSRHYEISCTFICPDYYDLKETLLNKIDDHFHKLIHIDHIISDYDISAIPETDLYISVLAQRSMRHFVQISPVLTSNDYHLIQNEISLIEQEKRYRDFEIFLRSYSRREFFEKDHSFSSKEDCISHICRVMEKEGYVKEGFRNRIMTRERPDNTAFHNLIAVPHALGDEVIRNGIYILLNEQPVKWDQRKVNLIILVAMEERLSTDFEQFLDVFIRLFENKNNMKILLESEDHSGFLNNISRITKTIRS